MAMDVQLTFEAVLPVSKELAARFDDPTVRVVPAGQADHARKPSVIPAASRVFRQGRITVDDTNPILAPPGCGTFRRREVDDDDASWSFSAKSRARIWLRELIPSKNDDVIPQQMPRPELVELPSCSLQIGENDGDDRRQLDQACSNVIA